jgi:hypothetical protein
MHGAAAKACVVFVIKTGVESRREVPCVHAAPLCQTPCLSVQVIMLTWSYCAAWLTDPGEVPVAWHPFPDDAVSSSGLHESCLAVETSVGGVNSRGVTGRARC